MLAMSTHSHPHEARKQKGVFKKVLKYFQEQAVENSSSRTYLVPSDLEPQQKILQSPDNWLNGEGLEYYRDLSETSPVAEIGNQRSEDAQNATSAPVFEEMKKVQYGYDNILQNYSVHVPERNKEDIQGQQYWVLYIHGGYFRDPKVDATSFRPAFQILAAQSLTSGQRRPLPVVHEPSSTSPTSSNSTLNNEDDVVHNHVAGYASINYRLAPHPGYAQTERIENYVKRNAKFPDQLNDIHAAIRHLQKQYQFGSKYILCGHSVGATLAFLAALKSKEGQIEPPSCIVGANGIYNFPDLHTTNPMYESMTSNAIPPKQFLSASPSAYSVRQYQEIQPSKPLNVLMSHSKKDGLVGWDQVEKMQGILRQGQIDDSLRVRVVETTGSHDSTWKEGRDLARVLSEAVMLATSG